MSLFSALLSIGLCKVLQLFWRWNVSMLHLCCWGVQKQTIYQHFTTNRLQSDSLTNILNVLHLKTISQKQPFHSMLTCFLPFFLSLLHGSPSHQLPSRCRNRAHRCITERFFPQNVPSSHWERSCHSFMLFRQTDRRVSGGIGWFGTALQNF